MHRTILAAALALPVLAACNPSLNWRETRFDGADLVAMMPCKPDRDDRTVPLAGHATTVHLRGCAAGGAMFSLAHALAPQPAAAGAALAHWRAATLAHLHATGAADAAFAPVGALALPQSVRVQAAGRRPDGQPVQLDAVWFARAAADGVHLFHAAVYTETAASDTAATYFAGLRFR